MTHNAGHRGSSSAPSCSCSSWRDHPGARRRAWYAARKNWGHRAEVDSSMQCQHGRREDHHRHLYDTEGSIRPIDAKEFGARNLDVVGQAGETVLVPCSPKSPARSTLVKLWITRVGDGGRRTSGGTGAGRGPMRIHGLPGVVCSCRPHIQTFVLEHPHGRVCVARKKSTSGTPSVSFVGTRRTGR
jgi:hypothetical protein